MTLPNIKEIYKLENEEILNEIIFVKKEMFKLRLKRAARQSFKPHSFKHFKHRLGQLNMVYKERLIL